MDSLDVPPSHPPPPPPKRLSRPKITVQIPSPTSMPIRGPPTASTIYWGPTKYHGRPPTTPASHISDPHAVNPYYNPFMHMYQSKASEFMFKQFEGFKDFTMNTAKSGLSAGEKTAFWFYNKLRSWSKKWFTHLFLTLCLVLYSVMGATIFMALEGPQEQKYDKNLTTVRKDFALRIEEIWRNESHVKHTASSFLKLIEEDLVQYENNYSEVMAHLINNNTTKKTWSFWNSMFYAGTIYTTIDICSDPDVRKTTSFIRCYIGVMSEGNEAKNKPVLTLKIPTIKTESESQTLGHLVPRSPEISITEMETDQKMSIRKRRNLSKNRGQGTRQREKTPEPGRTLVPHEDTTSDDEDMQPQRSSREIEADNTYEEMKRLVQEQANVKDPVYDLDTDDILEARLEANARRRRSVSPFAVPDTEETCKLERKGSFVDPSNKLLTANYIVSPKDEEPTRRNSLTIEPSKERKHSLTPPANASPSDIGVPFPIPTTPKKLEEVVYPDEVKEKPLGRTKSLKTPASTNKEEVFTFDEKEVKPPIKPATPKSRESGTPAPGELVTRIIQVERTPSKKLSQENKPVVEVRERERIVRTPSRKLSSDIKPVLKQQTPKPAVKDESLAQTPKVPPVKPARSKSATRFGSKTSESEMSEDQVNQQKSVPGSRRRVVPTPRRFQKNRSPRANRSQSVARVQDIKVVDNTGLEVTETTKDIIQLLEKRARSLSISKDDPRIPVEYKGRTLQTPINKTPVSRTSRGISCPKTIQIISGEEILTGIKPSRKVAPEPMKRTKRSTSYIDASQSEYTSSCYSSSPSENEYDFDLSEKTAELTRKLKKLRQEVEQRSEKDDTDMPESMVDINKNMDEPSSVLRKRSVADKNGIKKERRESLETKNSEAKNKEKEDKVKQSSKSRWKVIANWQHFKREQKVHYDNIILLKNRCLCDLLILIIMCGLGGIMFKYLEGSFENAYKCGARGVKRDFIESLWRGSHYLREEDWKSMARKKLYEFENQLHTAHEAGVTSYSGQRSWNFMNSFVYCLTLMTTIGYGHIAPKTMYGRLATIIYAIIGIPLFLIVLADFGKLFTRIIKFFWAFIRRFYYTRSCRKVRRTVPVQEVMKGLNIVQDFVRRPSQIFNEEEIHGADALEPPPVERRPSDVPPPLPPKPGQVKEIENETEPGTPAPSAFEIDDEFNLPISVAIVILIIYIIIGAVGYSTWETWNFFESFYFVFISMSTIGLGDLVPDHPMFMMASIFYLVFGLALTSMCINVVQVKLSDTFKKASAKLGATIGLKVAEEDGSLVPMTPEPTEIVPVHKPKVTKEEAKSAENDEGDVKNR